MYICMYVCESMYVFMNPGLSVFILSSLIDYQQSICLCVWLRYRQQWVHDSAQVFVERGLLPTVVGDA